MSLINNIDGLENSPNAGGAPWFQVVLPNDVATIPDVVLDQITTAITLNSGAFAYNVNPTVGTVGFTENTENVRGRTVYSGRFSFSIPKDRADILNYTKHLNNKGVIAIVRDANGQKRLMGTKDQPAYMRMVTRTLGTTTGGRNQYQFEIVLSSPDPIPFYEVSTHLPAPALTCPPETLVVTTNDATPDFGQSINVTGTATNFTPNSYEFFVPDACGGLQRVQQAGNVYAYTVAMAGSITIYVAATDGTHYAFGSVTITVFTIYEKHSLDAFYDFGTGLTMVSDRVDEVADQTTNANDATAPSASTRPIPIELAMPYQNGLVSAEVNSQDRLVTPISFLQSGITLCGVIYVQRNGHAASYNAAAIFGGDATPASNYATRYAVSFGTTSPYNLNFDLRNASGASAGTVSGPTVRGLNVFVATYDGTTIRLNLNGTIYTATYTGSLWAPASGNFVLFNANASGASYTVRFTEPTALLAIKNSALSTADADQLYDDLLLLKS